MSVIDNRPGVFAALGSTFNGTMHEGLANDVRDLREAGIEFADAFVAVTQDDNVNAMSVQLAKQVFGVPRTLARLDQPGRAEAYRALEIDYVAGAHITASVIRQRILDQEYEIHTTFPDDSVEVFDLVVGDEVTGVKVGDLDRAEEVRVAAVRRGSRTHIPGPDFELEPRDLLVVAMRRDARARLKKHLAQMSKTGTEEHR